MENKLIAEFLGYSQPHPDYKSTTYWYKKDESPLVYLMYDTDWNQLMQVVEKIEDLGNAVNIKGISCTITEVLSDEPIVSWVLGERKNKINLVYTACVEFIKLYNEKLNA